MCDIEAATQDCAFCLGRAAGRRGEPAASNPYPQVAARRYALMGARVGDGGAFFVGQLSSP